MYIADTSFIISVALSSQPKHEICAVLYTSIRSPIYLPQSTLAEISYMLRQLENPAAVLAFLRLLPKSKYRLEAVMLEDIERTTVLLEKYHDTRLDFVDASVVAVAERLSIKTILTTDYRDFGPIRPRHVDYFELLPG